jgi:hypothetical protein
MMRAVNVQRLAAVALLLAIGAHRLITGHRPADVAPYHAAIRDAVAKVPTRIDGWVGQDVPMPVQATAVLRPNAVISRHYLNVENGSSAGMVFVHCSDAHDMAGHFPLRCYPARGWEVASAEPRDWQIGDLCVSGTEYHFTRTQGAAGNERKETLIVANCLMRPGHRMFRDMNGMARDVVGAGGQATGAAQVQVYFDESMPQDQREKTVVTLLGGIRPVLDVVLDGTATPKQN